MAEAGSGERSGDAPAKVNLYLHVVGRRADGYHLIESLFAFAAFGDTLSAAPSERLVLDVEGPFAAGLEADGNLVLRAAEALRRYCGIAAGAHLRLTKRIPLQAGLGGGSADAAAALRLLSALWRVDLPAAELQAMALALGADVPACLHEAPLQVSGAGERLAPAVALPPCALVLVNPGVPLPTARVFGAFGGAFTAADPLVEEPADAAALAAALARRRNDLEPAARSLVPEVGDSLDLLAALPGILLARMSGSGATCFGLAAGLAEAESAAAALRLARPGWWVAAGGVIRPEPQSGLHSRPASG